MYAANTGEVRFIARLLEVPGINVNIENHVSSSSYQHHHFDGGEYNCIN